MHASMGILHVESTGVVDQEDAVTKWREKKTNF